MMNVQVPIFAGFSNIGICPGPFPGIAVCILDKIDKTHHLSSELQVTSFKYLPYYQNHVYILFPDNEDQMGNVFYFGSDGDMQRHLHYHLGSRQVHGRYLESPLRGLLCQIWSPFGLLLVQKSPYHQNFF